MNKRAILSCLVMVAGAHAQTPAAPAAPQKTAPATTAPRPPSAPAAQAPASAPGTPRPVAPVLPVPKPPAVPAPAVVAPAPVAEAPAPAPLTLEQRRQLELLANAERIDKANRELLARNQELQLQNETLTMQVNVIRRDRSSEGIWKGALAVIAGFLMGWYFSGSGRRKSSW